MDRRKHEMPTRRRGFAPALEGLELRELPSTSALLATNYGQGLTRRAAALADQASGVPTPHELKRQQFIANFRGEFVTGRPQFKNQTSQTFLKGGGISNMFLHGDLQMAYASPIAQGQTITGQAVMIVKNISNTGNELVLDLEADPASLDSRGRPTRFTWTVDSASGGTFSSSTGQGTAKAHYFQDGRSLPLRATGAGKMAIAFRGSIYVNGLFNVLRGQ